MNLITQLEEFILLLETNQNYHKKVYQDSCDIDDFDEFERVSKSSRQAIMLLKKSINSLQNLKSVFEENQGIIVKDVEISSKEDDTSKKIDELTQELQKVTTQRDDLESKLEIANKTIKDLQLNIESNLNIQNLANITTEIPQNNITDILEVFCVSYNHKVHAYGKYNVKDNTLTVLKGSTINSSLSNIKINKEVLFYRNNPEYVDCNFKVLQDIKFNSSSSAGVFVYGYSVSGYEVWKLSNNITLNEYFNNSKDNTNNIPQNSVQHVLYKEEPSQKSSISFKILNESFTIDSYLDMYYKVLEILLLKYPYNIATLGRVSALNVPDVSVFSYYEHNPSLKNIPEKRMLPNNLWVGIIDDKDTILNNIDKILEICKCSKSEFCIL